MEALIALLLIFLGLVLVVFPIWALIRIRTQAEDIAWLRSRVDTLDADLRSIASRASTPVANQPPEARSPSPVKSVASPIPTVVQDPPTSAPPVRIHPDPTPAPNLPRPETPPLVAASLPAAQPEIFIPLPTDNAPPPLPPLSEVPVATLPPPSSVARPREPAINWEQFMGVKLFLWLGGFALFLGAVFFVKLSIEQGWIPPEVRVALGFLLGVGLVVGGVILSGKRYAFQGQTLCATGIVTLYAMATICTPSHLGYLGSNSVLALMVLITATAFLLAVRLDAKVVALLGMLGGFLTPILLSTGQDNSLGLFTYIGLLDLGLIAVALHRRWHFLVPLAALGTAIMQIGWADKFLNNEKTLVPIVVCLVFDALFLAGFALARARRQASRPLSLSVAGLAFLSFAFAWYLGAETPVGLQPGRWLTFLFLADLCILGLVLLDVSTVKLHLIAGTVVFALLGAWTFQRVSPEVLPWALAGYLVFAVLHSAFPLIVRRLHPSVQSDRWSQLFTPLALLLVLGPVLNSPYASSAIWPAILLLDLVAIGLAWITASLAALVLVLVLTLSAAGQSIFRIPTYDTGGSLLLIIGGFALLFFIAGLGLAKRLLRISSPDNPDSWLGNTRTLLPSLSSLLPFVLLVMATERLSMPSPGPVFGLALLLVVMSLGLSRLLVLGALPGCALAGVLTLAYTWQTAHLQPHLSPALPLIWYLGFYGIFTAFPFFFRRIFSELRGPWLASAAAGPLFFPLILAWVKRNWPALSEVMGLLPAAFALPALACVVAIVRMDPIDHPRRLGRLALFGGVSLLFITLIFPLQFDQHREWITISWALEGAAVLWLFHRVPHRGLPIAGVLLLGTAFVRLAFNPAVLSYHLRGQTPIFNWYLYTYGLVVVSLLGGARLLAPPRNQVLGLNAPVWLQTFAGVLLFFLLNIEIADYFNSAESSRLRFDFSGNFARDMSYTIGWALYAITLLIVGIWKKAPGARYAALGLLGVTLIKLFFHDLARLDQLYRIGALMGVAVVAILASFLYQRFLPPDEKKPSTP